MSFEDYYKEVLFIAMGLGYNKQVVDCFMFDIERHYEKGLTVDECVEIEFQEKHMSGVNNLGTYVPDKIEGKPIPPKAKQETIWQKDQHRKGIIRNA